MDYIHFNPVKHGVAAHPAAWPFSSFLKCVAQGVYPEGWALARVSLSDVGGRPQRERVG